MGGGGRSYEFNPETADPKSYSRSVLRDNKEHVAHERDLPEGGEKISYGKKFSQTEELYTVRQMNKELEELAREDGMLEDEEDERGTKGTPAESHPTQPTMPGLVAKSADAPAAKKDKAKKQKAVPAQRGNPIGALPPQAEPPPKARFTEVFDDAQRYLAMLRGGVKDASTAAMRLARLPVEVAILAAEKLRPRHA